jgi:tetratricopeptide (TPR) repeat protein
MVMLKLIGYWAPVPHQESPWPDVRRAVRVGWRATDRGQLIAYLNSGHYLWGFLGSSTCRFKCHYRTTILGWGELTDGEWLWPEGLAHYVERHSVVLPDEFVASASARGWKVPPKDHVPDRSEAKVDHSFWLDWATRLPDNPTTTNAPDSLAVAALRLAVRFPGVEYPDEQIAAFDDDVWDMLQRDGYGHTPIFGRVHEHCYAECQLEGVSVERWDTLLAAVLDGLRRHGLVNRAEVIRIEPDPGDWHRDRDRIVWPDSKQPAVALWRQGSAHADRGEYGEALADLTEAIRLEPQWAAAYLSRGDVWRKKGDPDRAITDYTEALRLSPANTTALVDRGWAYYDRGLAYHNNGHYDKAMADYTEALRPLFKATDTQIYQIYFNRGTLYHRRGETDRAIADYTEAIRLDRHNSRSYTSRGIIFAEQGEYVRAIADFSQAVRLDPKDTQAYCHRGKAYCEKGEYEEAFSDFMEVIRLDSINPRGYALRAKVYRALGDEANAASDECRAKELSQ